MLSATSRRNAVLQAAASSNVNGGTRRVFVRPGLDALAITAIPQAGIEARSLLGTVVRISSQTSRPIRRWLRAFRAAARQEKVIHRARPVFRGGRMGRGIGLLTES